MKYREEVRNPASSFRLICSTIVLVFLFHLPVFARNVQQTGSEDESVKKGGILEMENLVVTAQKREQKIQDVPASITAFSMKDIEDAGIKTTDDISAYVPNLSSFGLSNEGMGFSYYGIRGQTNFNSYSNSVGIYIDDVPRLLSCNVTASALWDVEQIEVLRGPQGNLYGMSSSGGIINITTRKPQDEWTGNGAVNLSNYNTRAYQLSVSGPVIPDTLFFSFSGTQKSGDSYIEEEGNDDRNYRFSAGRAQVRWMPSSKLDLTLSVETGSQDKNYTWFSIADDDPYKIPNHNFDEYDDLKYQIQSLKAIYETSNFDIVAILGNTVLDQKGDMEMFSGGALYRKWANEPNMKSMQEFRLVSNDKASPLKWMAGVFLQQGTDDNTMETVYSGMTISDLDSETKKTTTSYFGQVSYAFTKKLTATAGIRSDTEKQEYKESTTGVSTTTYQSYALDYDLEDTWSAVSPRLSVDFRLDNNMMVYGSAAKGFKAGGFVSSDSVDKRYDPEEVMSYEIGMKSSWPDSGLIFNLCGFYTIADDLQTFYYEGLNFRYENTAKAVMTGFEAELMASPMDNLKITVPIGYVQSEIKEHEISSNEGNKVPMTPDYTAGITAHYTMNNGIFMRGEYNMTGKTYYDEENELAQNAYGVLNARVGYDAENYTVSAYVNNALDEEYYTYIYAYTSCDFASVGAPLTAGVELSARF